MTRTMNRWAAMGLGAILTLAACGGGPGPDDVFDDGNDQDDGNGQPIGQPDGDGGPGSGAGDTGDPNAPITATTDGTTFGYEVGRCEFIDDAVYARARRESQNGGIAVELLGWEAEMAYSQREGRVSLTQTYPDGGFLELVADSASNGTSWDWTVNGNRVEVTARMANRATANLDASGWEFVDYEDVTISIDCPQGTYGTPTQGVPEYAHEEFTPRTPGVFREPGSVTIDLDGTTYVIGYLVHCVVDATQSESVLAEGESNEADVFLSGSGGFGSHLAIGDPRDFEGLVRYEFGDQVINYEISGSTATWSGTLTSADGEDVPATVTVTCG